MDEEHLYSWLETSFDSLPIATDPTFRAIWLRGVLRSSNRGIAPDLVDELSARLICNAVVQREQLLIIFPDGSERRGAFLFASALVIESTRRIRMNIRGGQILYFGSTVGIREHLSQVRINNLVLDTVFPQGKIQRNLVASKGKRLQKGEQQQSEGSFNLPTVLAVYAPADPISLCQRYRPNWIAIDCADEAQLRWLRPLIEYAKRQEIPVIAWVTNPLSRVIEEFYRIHGQVFRWPSLGQAHPNLPGVSTSTAMGLRHIFENLPVTSLQPVLIHTDQEGSALNHLQEAYIQLSQISANPHGHFAVAVIQLAWRYLRSIENLCVPLELYESEIENLWGGRSLIKTRALLERYADLFTSGEQKLQDGITAVKDHLNRAHDWFAQNQPPLWHALVNLSIDKLDQSKARLFVFPTNSNRKLFVYGLLSYHNITVDDLRELNVGLVTLHDLYDMLTLDPHLEEDNRVFRLLAGLTPKHLNWEYWLVGIPSLASTPYLVPLLNQPLLHCVLYAYQQNSLERRVAQWEAAVRPGILQTVEALAAITKQQIPLAGKAYGTAKLSVEDATPFSVEQLIRPIQKSDGDERGMWEEFDLTEEFAVLMRADQSFSLPESMTHAELVTRISNSSDDFLSEVFVVEFDSGEYVLLAEHDKINVIVSSPSGTKTDERFVSSLRPKQRIVFIQGQRKQSLFELIISRVYRNPAINLHVKLVERWQEDFAVAHRHKMRDDKQWNLDRLFEEMKVRGSSISDPQPLRNWLDGDTLRPLDGEDLRRLAEIFNLEFVREHYMRIHRAGGRLAGLHVSLSRRLNSWLSNEALDIAASGMGDNDVIDEALDLTFQDFRDSLLILQVTVIRKQQGFFSRDMLGRLGRG